MKRLLTLTLSLSFLFAYSIAASAQDSSTSSRTAAKSASSRKRGPVFRANKDQVNQAQAILKGRGFYSGTTTGKLDDATRAGLKEYQKAEGLKVTGTLNKSTLEKMSIELTDKQKAM
ncbi:MAG TPA: peptidoglycan-binding domain-containing protein [Pyrinomonadaceae bacterium]|nr:peptidoglycan-binding domain-containing protein [Pyrinomonadaceae bacterium]HET9787984.1 peptidoglycan-binding domain-containing protein [Pyrinomonadaceae bacterium]